MLTAAAVEKAKPGTKQRKIFDGRGGGGLFLLVATNGSKLWRMKYRFAGRENTISLGAYPEVTLADARLRRNDARKLLAAGIDPVQNRRAERAATADSFEAVAREWFATKVEKHRAASYVKVVLARLENNVLPWLGKRPIRGITAPDVLSVLRRIEQRGAHETAHKVRGICSQIFVYAIQTDRVDRDPAADLRGALKPVETEHYPAVIDPGEVGPLLRVLDGYEGTIIVKSALRLAPLVFVRPGELRQAEWAEIDLAAGKWIIPNWRMKMRQALQVPLSTQAVAILKELRPVTGDGPYVFPSARSGSRPMSDNAVLAALRRCGIPKEELVGHGFRAMARTILDEVLHYRVDLIEHQLGHAVRDPLGRAYNRTSFLKERTEMMQAWADYLDTLKADDSARKRA